jgi:hypothetical protein
VRGEWILCALVASGCDVVWRLDDLREVTTDAPPIAVGCNEASHDEDGDNFGDECDRCPGISDDQADADGDGVGDACDPSSLENHQLALFVSFAADEPWRTVNGNWLRDGDALVYESVTLGVYGVSLYQGAIPEPPFVVEYYFTVDMIEAQGSGLSVLVDSDNAGKAITCGIQRHESPIQDVVRNTYAQAVVSSETEIMTVVPGGYRVVASYDRTKELRCALSSDSGLTGGATTMPIGTAPPPGALGLRSLRIGTRIHYVAIYKQT